MLDIYNGIYAQSITRNGKTYKFADYTESPDAFLGKTYKVVSPNESAELPALDVLKKMWLNKRRQSIRGDKNLQRKLSLKSNEALSPKNANKRKLSLQSSVVKKLSDKKLIRQKTTESSTSARTNTPRRERKGNKGV